MENRSSLNTGSQCSVSVCLFFVLFCFVLTYQRLNYMTDYGPNSPHSIFFFFGMASRKLTVKFIFLVHRVNTKFSGIAFVD